MKTIIIILFLTCCLVQVSDAQVTVNPETCIPDSILSSPISYTDVNDHTSTVMDIDIGTVDYKYGTGGGVKHIAIDWTTLTNKNPNMSDLAIREFIINEILRSYSTGTYRVYYKEDCVKEFTCTISLEFPTDSAICCENPDDIAFFQEQSYTSIWDVAAPFRYFDIKRKVVCGHKCCMDTYTISGSPTPLSITRGQGQGSGISVTTCPENNDYHCKKRHSHSPVGAQVIPCEDEGCYQWR